MKIQIYGIIVIIMIILGAGIIAMLSIKITGKDDQPLEEVAEEIIKIVTGDDIDVTPKTPEH